MSAWMWVWRRLVDSDDSIRDMSMCHVHMAHGDGLNWGHMVVPVIGQIPMSGLDEWLQRCQP